MTKLYGGMEGGGSKFVCAVGNGKDEIVEEVCFPTTTPVETLGQAIAFFQKYNVSAIGLAPFGPLDLNPASPTYGSITATPKPGWAGTNVVAAFQRIFDVPLAFELDVISAAFGEYSLIPENRRLESLVYFTIGTGINAGVIINGKVTHGLTHPEAGHMRLPHDLKKDPFPGTCPFHGDCFEGMASGPALARRWRKPAETLPNNHPAWDQEAAYIAYALVNVILTLSPQRIVLGGGVMEHQPLYPRIRGKVRGLLNGYLASPVLTGAMKEYIVPPALGKRSGVLGALALAKSSV
ncbi:MAG: ROK family protein [Anaerolineales bacterium]|nr:ROK family protein [Anaerolineales bacterium]